MSIYNPKPINVPMNLSENKEIDHKEDEVLMKQYEMVVSMGTPYPPPHDLIITDELTGEETVLEPIFWSYKGSKRFSIEHQLVIHRQYTFKVRDINFDVKWEDTLWTSSIYENY